jgi:hypothetical protein
MAPTHFYLLTEAPIPAYITPSAFENRRQPPLSSSVRSLPLSDSTKCTTETTPYRISRQRSLSLARIARHALQNPLTPPSIHRLQYALPNIPRISVSVCQLCEYHGPRPCENPRHSPTQRLRPTEHLDITKSLPTVYPDIASPTSDFHYARRSPHIESLRSLLYFALSSYAPINFIFVPYYLVFLDLSPDNTKTTD